MFIVGVFVVLLVIGLAMDELSWNEAIGFVIAFLASFIALRLLHAPLFWIMLPTLFLNVILLFKVVGYNPRWPQGGPR